MYDYQNMFKKFLGTNKNLNIIKCKVCNDVVCYPDDIEYTEWKKIENSDYYVCKECLENGYLTSKEAKNIDKYNIETYGTKYMDFDKHLIRQNYTWDEADKLKKEYKKELEKYLIENYLDFYNDNIEYFR